MRQYYRWDQELEADDIACIVLDVALWLAQSIEDVGLKDEIESSLLFGRLKEVAKWKIDYAVVSLGDARAIRQISALFSKRTDIDFGVDRAAVAKEKFLAAEESCKLTNECFRSRALGRFSFPTRVERVLWHASRKIGSILGDVPSLSELRFRFGPGATTQISKREASPRAKLGLTPACSSELFPMHLSVLREMPAWADILLEEGPHRVGSTPIQVQMGKVALVLKNSFEDRSIVVEPMLNTMCQAGIGDMMADRLRRVGVDIRDQSRNRNLAREGSIHDQTVTVDLQSASDTISYEVVYDLLGLEWASYLSRFRTGTVTLDGVPIRLEKFSSMGNGFTFPLETCIFYALAFGCCVELGLSTHDVAAYGDDIVIPTEAYSLLCDVFTSCGFVVNRDKSFASGPFRESCGADYYRGADIRPFYLRSKEGRLRVCHLFQMHNFFYRFGYEEISEYLQSYLDPSIRLFGPDGYGDGHLLGKWVVKRKKAHVFNQFDGGVFDTFTWRPRRSFRTSPGDRVLPVYSTYLSAVSLPTMPYRAWAVSRLPNWLARIHNAWFPSPEGRTESDFRYDDRGNLAVTMHGVSGVNRISIYTLARP